MNIEKLNELIYGSQIFGRDFIVKTYETFPNVHPTIKNPLNHLNDFRVEFSMYDVNIFGVHMLSEMTIKDFFDEVDKIANERNETYKNWKQKELREYNIDKILNDE